MKHENGQRGAIIVEATLALPFFMFAIFTLLSVIQICYAQARVNIALDSATKQLAEYSHVYYVLHLDKYFTGQGGKSSDLANQVAEFLSSDIGDNVKKYDDKLGQTFLDAGEALKGDSLTAILENLGAQGIIQDMLKGNLKDGADDSADDFMRRNHIINLDTRSEAGEKITDGAIFMRVDYDIQVVKLLQLDYKFHLSHCAYVQAWKD